MEIEGVVVVAANATQGVAAIILYFGIKSKYIWIYYIK